MVILIIALHEVDALFHWKFSQLFRPLLIGFWWSGGSDKIIEPQIY